MADYRIDLGVGLNQSQLNQVKQVLESIENQKRDVIYNVDFNIKNASKLTEVSKEIEKIQTQLNSVGSGKNIKAAIPIDSKSIETTLNKVNESIKKIRNSLGTVDSKKGVQSLLTTVNKINTALDKVSKQFTDLNRNLTNLSSKDFSLNFDFGFGNSSKNPEQAIKELNMLKREVEEYEKYFRKFYSMGASEANVDPINRLIFQYNQRNQVYGLQLQEAMSKGSDAQKIAAYKQYLNLIKETAAIGKISLEPVEFRLAESGEFIKVRNEVDETQQKLKELFSGGINAENLHRTLSEIVDDLKVIKESLAGVSSEADSPINQLTQSFNKLSESIEKLVSNAALVKNVLGDGLTNTTNVETSAINKIEKASDDSTAAVIQNEKKKQEAYKATADAVGYHAGVISKLNKAETNGRFYGSNRGTGYFGTGHYFVDSATKHELDNDNYYNKMPYTSVDISQYDNLFKATTDEVAEKLHSFLGNLTRFTQGADDYDISELFAQFKSVFGDTIMDVKEFGSRLDQLKTFMSNSSLDDRSDSVSTQFMKSLGYEGVDTRGTSYADTRYGTVIYDLKEESILQANITDELQKQGQMLEKINYEKGQAFDKDTDARIQGELDAQAKKREIAEEFQNSFDTTNLNKIEADLSEAQNRLKQIDEIINDCQNSINNADQEAKKFAKDMESIGLGVTDEEIADWKSHHIESMQSGIDDLSQERVELQSKIPILEEAYNKENQLANEAYKQAQQVVEQRHLEAQQAQETANAVVQAEEKKQQAYRETADAAEQISNNKTVDVGQFDDDTADTKELNVELKKLKDLAHQIGQLDFKIVKSDYNDEINQVKEFERQLELVKKRYNETIKSLSGQNVDIGSIATPEFVEARNKIAEFEAKIDDTKRKLAEKLQLKLETGDFTAQVSRVESDAKRLSNTYEDVENGIKEVNAALNSMQTASADGDIERLISANKEYEAALKKVKNQLEQNKIAEQNASAQQKLTDDIGLFQNKIDSWLTKNSAATKQFGSTMLELKARAEGCDRVTLNHLEAEFKQVDKAAEAANKKTKTVGDSLKAQFSKYSTYFGVAELFMWVEQGLRDMFEQVKLIDSAMTELKKVTDETDASYDKFLTNAATRAREIGTTIDGLVASTADFARLGYGFEDAQGLAEVANIYAVVGDEINGVEGATESLVSTMAAFKDEMNGMSDTDFAMSIIDKFNEIGNNFAISSGGIGEALERSASSLMAANNTIDESIALITAANTVVQDPAAVGTAFKTISMRIRGAKTELEEAGLETEGMVESTAKLRQEILALSGVDIMENANEFKSTYAIMDELAAKWEDLTDIQQAKCLPDNAEMH